MKQKFSIRNILMGAVVAFLLIFALLNFMVLKHPVGHLLHGKINFQEFTAEVAAAYTSSITGKYGFINLNGWVARRMDQTVLNKVVTLKNGMLTNTAADADIHYCAERVLELKAFLERRGTEFIWVQAPYKIDMGGQLLPEGIEDCGNENADALLNELRMGGVNVLDLRPAFSATPEQVEKSFFRTDHHWNFSTALEASGMVVQELDRLFPEKTLDLSLAEPELWEAHELKDWFLGSQGKRVGIYYGGTDDVVYYTPGFPTELSCAIPSKYRFDKGDFSEANMRSELTQERDYFDANAYALYIGGDYSLVQHRNLNAPNDIRILWIQDSFSLPLTAYLSTMFREIDVIDPRNARNFSIAEYADFFQPDVLAIMMYPISIASNALFEYDTASAEAKDLSNRITVLPSRDVTVDDSENHYVSIAVSLRPGQSYILEFDDIEMNEAGDYSGGTAVCVYDTDAEKIVDTGFFDVEYCRRYGGFRWFFTAPQDVGAHLELRLAAGIPGEDEIERAVCRGLRLDAVG